MKKNLVIAVAILCSIGLILPGFLLAASDQEITDAYQRLLKRDPQQHEMDFYHQGNPPIERIVDTIASSDERKQVIDEVYREMLNRHPQQKDLDFYYETRSDVGQIRKVLNAASERRTMIVLLYREVLGRDAKESEIDFHVTTVGTVSKIKQTIMQSGEYKDKKKDDAGDDERGSGTSSLFGDVVVWDVDPFEETVTFTNLGNAPVNMTGWSFNDAFIDGPNIYWFPSGFVLSPLEFVEVSTWGGSNFDGVYYSWLYWNRYTPVWNTHDFVYLYDAGINLVDYYEY